MKQLTATQEANLTRYLNGEIKNSKYWNLEERKDHRNAIVTYKPTGERMLALTWMPYQWTINQPSIGKV